jgi:hypothetical protein
MIFTLVSAAHHSPSSQVTTDSTHVRVRDHGDLFGMRQILELGMLERYPPTVSEAQQGIHQPQMILVA